MKRKIELPNYIDEEGALRLIKCPVCGKENYTLNILSSIFNWCGYEAKNDLPSPPKQQEP